MSVLASVIGGLVISYLIYLGLNFVVEKTNTKWKARLLPYVFLGPVLLLLAVFILAPTALTVFQSLIHYDSFGLQTFGGVTNYVQLLSSGPFLQTLLNNLLWIIFVPALTVIVGLFVATLADRLGPNREKLFKTLIFIPFAISGIAAGTMWSFVYFYNSPGQPQIGLLNAIFTGISGADPVSWLATPDFRLNSFLIMAVMIWLNAGYAMVLLSAAIKGVPEETIEAARIDGATEQQAFFRVIMPQIRATIVAVFITVLISVMKVFDIVLAMTTGQYNTNVLGLEFYNQLFSFQNQGKASAVVVILLVAVIPVIIYQIRSYREQEALR
ncbi:carbohydrate ABC transporter permease [uncultured Amnibacterium sp.]|uniref:carbohydrate ABC transporter permease n=1 Tax=uncultured Amnibacterium sp. TaxID=1631851 RepID=UPI0035C9C41C